MAQRQPSSIQISAMLPEDIRDVVAVHLKAFPGFFLSGMGSRFLSVFYSSVLEDASGIGLVARGGEGVAGFVAGSVQPSGFYKRILVRKGFRFAIASIVPTMRNPAIIARLLRSFRRTSEYRTPGAALLMSIAVLPSMQGGAVGQRLVAAFVEEARRRLSNSVYLTTDHIDNEKTNAFYRKMGFTLARTYTTAEGRLMNEYFLAIGEAGAS